MTNSRYSISFKDVVFVVALVVLTYLFLILTGCERRELYVYGDEFHSVELEVDWRQYASSDPDGMTVWFYPLDDPAHEPYRTTTASVRHHDLYLPGGRYHGVVVDYSPEEYSRQAFHDMDVMSAARVEATPASYQPDSLMVVGEGVPSDLSAQVNEQLFGAIAWNGQQTDRPAINEASGLYTVANQPESMGLDTLMDKEIDRGRYGDYIPWQERDTYQSQIRITKLFAQPTSLIWKLRIRIYIRSGFNQLWQSPASISGLADGHFLPLDVNTDHSCLIAIEGWDLRRTGDDCGYIETTLNTFGLRPSSLLSTRTVHRASTRGPEDPGWNDYYTNVCAPEEIRLNLAFVLRDHATTVYYHFNVGQYVVSFDKQLVLRIELGPDVSPIDLPFVDAYNGTGFGAEVTPWVDEPPVEVVF